MDTRKFLDAKAARVTRGLVTLDYDLSTAIVDRVITSPGTMFYLDKTSTGICFVQGNTDQGFNESPLLASPGFSMSDENGFSGFRFSAPAQPGKVLRVVIASGMSIKPGDPVQSGSVATPTVDAALARTLAQMAMLAGITAPAVAGQFAHAELWNPAANTKKLYLESMLFSVATAGIVFMGDFSAALASVGPIGFDKYVGGTAGVGAVRYENNAVAQITSIWTSFNMAAGVNQVLNFREPIVISPGKGVVLQSSPVNTNLSVTFEWFEQ